jgi:GTP cyclohydrolase II
MFTHQHRARATSQTGTLWRIASTRLSTKWGIFDAMRFERESWTPGRTAEWALALKLGDLSQGAPLLRVHSQCLTGEVFGSLRCDCGGQLNLAMQAMAQEGRGLVIYEFQEDRGICRAYELQEAGIDPIEANHALGFETDFSLAAAILRDLRIARVRLLTNNPRKVRALSDADIEVVERLACEVRSSTHSLTHLQTKRPKTGHALSLQIPGPGHVASGTNTQL